DVLGRGLDEALDVAAARKVLAHAAQHDDAHARVLVERLEDETQLIALRHGDDIERRPVEHHVGAFMFGVEFDAETVERGKARVDEGEGLHHAAVPFSAGTSAAYSPATSLRRSSLPTGDFGIASTNT